MISLALCAGAIFRIYGLAACHVVKISSEPFHWPLLDAVCSVNSSQQHLEVVGAAAYVKGPADAMSIY